MSDLIDRSKLLAALPHVDLDEKDCKVSRAGVVIDMAFIISEQPTVDAVEVIHGHWIWNEHDIGKAIRDYCDHGGNAMQWKPYFIYCSHCLKGYCVDDNCMFEQDPDYCPNCGAKMDEEVSE